MFVYIYDVFVQQPSTLAQACLGEGDLVDVAVRDGALSLVPRRNEPSLADLIAMIAPENIHGETFAELHGAEIW